MEGIIIIFDEQDGVCNCEIKFTILCNLFHSRRNSKYRLNDFWIVIRDVRAESA